MTNVSSCKLKTKAKNKLSKNSASDPPCEDRVELFLAEQKAKSKARVAARKQQKLGEQKAADEKKRKAEERREKKELAAFKRKSDAEFAEFLRLWDYFDAEAERLREKQKLDNQNTADSDRMSISSIKSSSNHSVHTVNSKDSDEMCGHQSESGSISSHENVTNDMDKNSDNPSSNDKTLQTSYPADNSKKMVNLSPDLLSYIDSVKGLSEPKDPTSDNASVATANAGNSSSQKTPSQDINEALNGYKFPSVTDHVIYCKAKIFVPANEKPTEQMRNTLIMFMTTLLKVDKDFVLYGYKDESVARYLKLPVKIPETPSKFKEFFSWQVPSFQCSCQYLARPPHWLQY